MPKKKTYDAKENLPIQSEYKARGRALFGRNVSKVIRDLYIKEIKRVEKKIRKPEDK